MLSHIDMRLGMPQSYVTVLTWMSGASGLAITSSPFLMMTVIGSRQHAQYDSRRRSLFSNGGMREMATDSMAQPAYEWNLSSIHTCTWLGKLLNGSIFSMLKFWLVWSTTTIFPSSS